ncbi:hypothetical protein CTAYLR_003070 [Chrysophaeum taylorii]|uniref:NAD(+) diphosphatase n=1 Tax=Chrysophaeum taylorii TaxID=2483200 RepID=A0AAD7XJN8_9STRA|nr:hypothetical protein CTAYLR_003070 [Chrysophaeum taylorii]
MFNKVVSRLASLSKTLTVVESSCGGLISASLMSVPGSSRVYRGGTVAYDTKRAKKLLLDDDELHARLIKPVVISDDNDDEVSAYVNSKKHWSGEAAKAYCAKVGTDYAVAEAGATGPTFRPEGLETGFSVISVADRNGLVAQRVVRSTHNDRERNMRLFADAAATLLSIAIDGRLDRATKSRDDRAQLEAWEREGSFVVVKGNKMLASEDDGGLARLAAAPPNGTKTFLGLVDDKPYFSVDVDDAFSGKFVDTRTRAPLLPALDATLAIQATALATWQRRSAWCASCGGPTDLVSAGTRRECRNCGAVVFPRQDPSIIVVVESRCGCYALLGRSPRHPPLVHTALAGFVEAGETFEDAVSREVEEETGVVVDAGSVAYLGSQPWPFPQSVMVAFSATADHTQPLQVDPAELEAARWFDRDAVREAARVTDAAVMDPKVADSIRHQHPDLRCIIPPQGPSENLLFYVQIENYELTVTTRQRPG